MVEGSQATDSRDVSLTIPARPDYLVLARLALSAVCRLTPLSPEEIADLKLAITEAANDYVDDTRELDDESRLNFGFQLLDDRLAMQLEGPDTSVSGMEQDPRLQQFSGSNDRMTQTEGAGGRVAHSGLLRVNFGTGSCAGANAGPDSPMEWRDAKT